MDIVLHVDIEAPAASVWRCLTDPEDVRVWWGSYVTLDARSGGSIEERWRDSAGSVIVTRGEIVRFEPPKLLALTWADEDWQAETRVRIKLAETGDGTRVSLSHAGWDRLESGATLRDQHEAGWRTHLDSLKSHVEGVARGIPNRRV